MAVQHCECTKCDSIVHFKIVNFMLREFYLNLKKKKREVIGKTPDKKQGEALIWSGRFLRICEERELKQKWRDLPKQVCGMAPLYCNRKEGRMMDRYRWVCALVIKKLRRDPTYYGIFFLHELT